MGLITINIIGILLFVGIPVENPVEEELDLFWGEVTRTVEVGDFEGYGELYHPDAVLVNGFNNKSYNIAKALNGWKQGFIDTKNGKMQAGVSFKFTQRISGEASAHEKGMFHYYTIDEAGKRKDEFVHMNALLVKKEGKWLFLMEHQQSAGTKAEWDALNQ